MRRDAVHDFNNLLVAIRGHAELLLDAVEPGTKEWRHAEQIAAAAYDAIELTRQLADAPNGETILLVEDDHGVRSLIHEVLQVAGYTVLEAADGEAAAAVAGAYGESIDLLVTDLVMPRLDGRALVEQLTEANPHVCVLCISGCEESPLEDAAFLQKSFTLDELTSAVRRLLDG